MTATTKYFICFFLFLTLLSLSYLIACHLTRREFIIYMINHEGQNITDAAISPDEDKLLISIHDKNKKPFINGLSLSDFVIYDISQVRSKKLTISSLSKPVWFGSDVLLFNSLNDNEALMMYDLKQDMYGRNITKEINGTLEKDIPEHDYIFDRIAGTDWENGVIILNRSYELGKNIIHRISLVYSIREKKVLLNYSGILRCPYIIGNKILFIDNNLLYEVNYVDNSDKKRITETPCVLGITDTMSKYNEEKLLIIFLDSNDCDSYVNNKVNRRHRSTDNNIASDVLKENTRMLGKAHLGLMDIETGVIQEIAEEGIRRAYYSRGRENIIFEQSDVIYKYEISSGYTKFLSTGRLCSIDSSGRYYYFIKDRVKILKYRLF